ncbi:MAG: glycosyltransferase [Solirubrobacteraceae bacterium]
MHSRPDVALIAPYPPLGVRHGGISGVASYASNLAGALADAGARVEVVAPFAKGEEPSREQDGAVAVRRAFPRRSGGVRAAVRAAIGTGAPVVHLQHEFFLYGGAASTPGLIAALQALRARRRKAVVTMHQVVDPAGVDGSFTSMHRVAVPPWAARGGLSLIQRALSRCVDLVLVHEPAFAELLPRAAHVPHGVEPSTQIDMAAARRSLGLSPDVLYVLCFGFLAPYKGLETVLEAATLAGPAVQAVIAGGPHPRLLASGDRYDEQLREHYGDRARFTGTVPEPELPLWFAGAEVAAFMYPRPFSSSGALALAIAHGPPVLVSPELGRTAGLPDQVVVPRDPAALAGRLRALAGDGKQLGVLRNVSAELGRSRRWSEVAARHLELYQEVQGASPAADQ